MDCQSLDEVRAGIDRLDRELLRLLAERGRYVEQAARFKRNEDEARAPARVEQVIAKVKQLALEHGLDPRVAEATWRAMVGAFVGIELERVRAGDTSGR